MITEILAFQVLGGREVKYFSCQKWFRALNCRASYSQDIMTSHIAHDTIIFCLLMPILTF